MRSERAMATFFDRVKGPPQQGGKQEPPVTIPRGPLLQPIVPPSDHKSPPLEKTLDWLVNRWPKPTIRAREIHQFGPPAARNHKSAIAMAESLAESGWLRRIPTRRHNMREWEIIRGPN